MKLNCNSFFDGEFDYLNLNEFYLCNRDKIADSKKPEQIQVLLNALDKPTYGGYAEDRKDVWKGTYMDVNQIYIHLGIDINVKEGTEVKCPFDALLVDLFTDKDTQIGWGGRFTIVDLNNPRSPFLILAHLDPESLVVKPSFKKGEVMGRVGTWPTNGNTFQHLHVQTIYNWKTNEFDGYGTVDDLPNNPNPFEIEFNI
jgi:hypothetical protein